MAVEGLAPQDGGNAPQEAEEEAEEEPEHAEHAKDEGADKAAEAATQVSPGAGTCDGPMLMDDDLSLCRRSPSFSQLVLDMQTNVSNYCPDITNDPQS